MCGPYTSPKRSREHQLMNWMYVRISKSKHAHTGSTPRFLFFPVSETQKTKTESAHPFPVHLLLHCTISKLYLYTELSTCGTRRDWVVVFWGVVQRVIVTTPFLYVYAYDWAHACVYLLSFSLSLLSARPFEIPYTHKAQKLNGEREATHHTILLKMCGGLSVFHSYPPPTLFQFREHDT